MSSLVNCRKRIAFMTHRRLLKCLFLLGIVAVTVGAEIPPVYQTAEGWSCHKCPRGQFVASDCASDDPASTDCRNCTGDRFQPNEWTSEKRCYNCDECDPGLDGSLGGDPHTPCTIFENAVCRCPVAFFWSQAQRRCEEVTECPPGQGVTHPATIKTDTVCEPCREEAYSAKSSAEKPCAACLICEEWQREASPCNQTHNRVCQNVSMATGIPPTPKHPQEVSDTEDSQTDNTVAIVAPVAVVTVVAILATVVGVFFYRRKNARQQADPEVTIDPRDNQGLLDGSNSSTRSSQTSTPSGGDSARTSLSTGGSDSLQYQSEPEKPCAATPFSDDGAAGTMDDLDGPGDETYPKSFALEPEGDDPSMPVQETGGGASPGPESYQQDSHDPPQSLDKIEKGLFVCLFVYVLSLTSRTRTIRHSRWTRSRKVCLFVCLFMS
ncbi:tumor necrosis factor receptor superfamily member 16-like [Branchiostoma floridae]|uniref:Tumor necrosis factor receptor superfamily member 16-like n=1 Tax=Branchiostoma floridae TaxID=7739 RepID=A0A9J7M8Y7_BRAFL|nr:tumor necrosis factor receptor superfamily member 16-like [Branchiostoma floridae]